MSQRTEVFGIAPLNPTRGLPSWLASSGLFSLSMTKHHQTPTYTAPAFHPYQMWLSVCLAPRSFWKESTRGRYLALTRYPVACYKNYMKNLLLSSQPCSWTLMSLVISQKSGSRCGPPQSSRRGPTVMQQIINPWAPLASYWSISSAATSGTIRICTKLCFPINIGSGTV